MAAKQLSDGNPEGNVLGQGTTDLIAFHGSTPTSQRTSAALSATHSLYAHTGLSLGANLSASVFYDYVCSSLQEIRTMLVAYGLHKGGA
jgi:hypothetical protein